MREINILNLGAGRQSTCLYLLFHFLHSSKHPSEVAKIEEFMGEKISLPRLDYAIFADTGDEPRKVYEHLEWLKGLNGPEILVRSREIPLSNELLSGINLDGNRFVSMPCFIKYESYTKKLDIIKDNKERPLLQLLEDSPKDDVAFIEVNKAGSIGIAKRQCTSHYKIEVVELTIKREIVKIKSRQRFPIKEVSINQFLGLSYEEPNRIIGARKRIDSLGWSTPYFPLYDLEMTANDCQEFNKLFVPHPVPRSACKQCPYHSNAEWRRLRDESPDEWEWVCELDEKLRNPDSCCTQDLIGKLYLHRSCVPLREAPINEPENRNDQRTFGFASECEGMCGV